MKLIDLLVQELPKRGGWPEGVEKIAQDYDGQLRYDGGMSDYLSQVSDNHRAIFKPLGTCDETYFVTREQYKAALQQPVWNGEGLPPVGCECRFYSANRLNKDWSWKGLSNGDKVKIIHHFVTFDGGPTVAAFVYDMHDGKQVGQAVAYCFEPLKTESEHKREETIAAIYKSNGIRARDGGQQSAIDVYDAIAAGKIPGVKLDV